MQMQIRLCQTELIEAVQHYVARKMQVPKNAKLSVRIEVTQSGPCDQATIYSAVVEVGGAEQGCGSALAAPSIGGFPDLRG